MKELPLRLLEVAHIRNPGDLFQGSWVLMKAHRRTVILPLAYITIFVEIVLAIILKGQVYSLDALKGRGEGSLEQGLAFIGFQLVLSAFFWLTFRESVLQGTCRTLFASWKSVLQRLIFFGIESILFMIVFFISFMCCILPAIPVAGWWIAAPFCVLEGKWGMLHAFQATRDRMRAKHPESTLAKTAWGKWFVAVSVFQLVQVPIQMTLLLGISFGFKQLANAYPDEKMILYTGGFIARYVQMFISFFFLAWNMALLALAFTHGELLREGNDLLEALPDV